MAGCCDAYGCEALFDDRFAQRLADRYRRRGLGRTEQRIIDLVASRGIQDRTVLEVGGGVGELQLELLRLGARSAVNLELVGSYEPAARQLAAEAGLTGRIERRVLDLAVEPEAVDVADIVLLHRVVCCYPDAERLLGAAAGRARSLVVFSHPPRHAASMAILGAQNAVFALSGKRYRNVVHRPDLMLEVLRRRGLEQVHRHRGALWTIRTLERVPQE